MIKYICDFCKKEIEGKEIIMKAECTTLMPNDVGYNREFALHMHEDCARKLIGEDRINERAEQIEKHNQAREERRKEREAKMRGEQNAAD